MEDETAKFVKALVDSEVAKRVYEDGALPAISEVGKLSGDVIAQMFEELLARSIRRQALQLC